MSIPTSNEVFVKFYNRFMNIPYPDPEVKQFVYRGVSSSEYKLYPAALRDRETPLLCQLACLQESECDLKPRLELEAMAVERFYRLANQNGLPLPPVREMFYSPFDKGDFFKKIKKCGQIPPGFYEIFALAQHYGIPTRFLDWSYDIHVALFFAAYGCLCKSDPKVENFALWALDTAHIRDRYFKEAQSEDQFKIVFVTPPYAGNPNLAAQKGLFTYARVPVHALEANSDGYWGESLKDMIVGKYGDKAYGIVIKKFAFPASEATPILVYLSNLGYNYSTIFPGLHSLREALKLDFLMKNSHESSKFR